MPSFGDRPRLLVVLVTLMSLLLVAAALPAGGTFRDDNGNVHEGYIEAIAAEGITKGCNPPVNDRFCPDDVVTRGQMAAFLVRALGLTATGSVDFVDDDGSVFEEQINRLAAAGITKGCNPPVNDRFCPHDPVRRDQMASFLGRALGLTPFVAAPFGGEIVVGSDQEPPTLNPFAPGGDNRIVTTIGNAYFGGVYDIDGETLELVPDLVTKIPTVANGGVVENPDGTATITYDIDPEAVWSDGISISGDDFQFTLGLILDPDVWTDKEGYEDIVSTSVEAKRFSMTLANPSLDYEMLFPIIFPSHAIAGTDFTNDWNTHMWPSAGPFVFDSWVPGQYLRVVRNDQYWKTDATSGRSLPFADAIVFEFIPNPEDSVDALAGGSVDVVEPPWGYAEMADTLAALGGGVVLESVPGPVWEHLNFQFAPSRLDRNSSSVNPDLDYRKGVMHALDREAIVDELTGGWSVALDSVTGLSGDAFATEGWRQYEFDLSTARDYLAVAEARHGGDPLTMVFTTSGNNDNRVRLAEMLTQMMNAAGIEYENHLEESAVFFGPTLEQGSWDVGSWAWVAGPGYAEAEMNLGFWDPDSPPPDGPNYVRWGSPGSDLIDSASQRYAEILDQLEATVDRRVALPLIREAEQILAENVVMIPLYGRPLFLAYRGDEVGGMSATRSSFTWNIGEWYRLP